MASPKTKSVIAKAKRIYSGGLRGLLEADHLGRFVAIEPESGDYFLADTIDAAVGAAQAKHPSKLSYVMKVGHPAALHVGGFSV